MFAIVWRFTTNDPAEFVRHYGHDGTWARLFSRSEGYGGTALLESAGVYLTIDRWTSREAWDQFRTDYASSYGTLDAECEALTTSEEKVGEFTEIG